MEKETKRMRKIHLDTLFLFRSSVRKYSVIHGIKDSHNH